MSASHKSNNTSISDQNKIKINISSTIYTRYFVHHINMRILSSVHVKQFSINGGDIKPRHVHTVSVSPDLEVEAQSH